MGKKRRIKLAKERKFNLCIAEMYVVAESKPEEVHLDLQPIPVFSSKDYEFWSIKMKTVLPTEGVI